MTRPIVIGVEASALSSQRTGIGNYLANMLIALPDVAGPMRIRLFANGPIDTVGLGEVTTTIARPPGLRGFVWQNTQLAAALLADPPDLFWGASGLLPLVRLPRTKTVVTIHDLVYRLAGGTLPRVNRVSRRLLQPASARSATRVVAVSQATADDVARYYGRRVDAVIHPVVNDVYGPVSADEVARVRTAHDLPDRYLLTLGTLEPRKNLGNLVAAALHLRQRGIAAPTLIIAGGRGWLDADLTSAIAEGEAGGVVRRLGFVPDRDMPGLYAGADYFIIASIYEGFGMPVVEAQLCGTRVLASDIPSLREASGGAAAFFDPTSMGIADCVARVLEGTIAVPFRTIDARDNDPKHAARRLWAVMESCLTDRRG